MLKFVLTLGFMFAVVNLQEIPDTKLYQDNTGVHHHESSVERTSDEKLAAIVEKRGKFETIRLAEALTLKAMRDANSRSKELTDIIEKRIVHISGLLKRFPYILIHLLKKNPKMVIGLPEVSFVYLTSNVGRGKGRVRDLPKFLISCFKNRTDGEQVDVGRLVRRATVMAGKLTSTIGQNYLKSTILRIEESVSFMEQELDKTQDMLDRLPELVGITLKGPYDTISDDRILHGYVELNNAV